MHGFLDQVKKLAEDVSTQIGCRLYDIEFVPAPGGRVLRVYIDKADPGGASIEDCSKVSRGMNEVLDANEEMIPGGNYDLEVSTPGLERPLREPWHFEAALGTMISVKTYGPLIEHNPDVPSLGKARVVNGTLVSYDDKEIRLNWLDSANAQAVEAMVVIPRSQVTKSHVVFAFEEPQEKNKKNKPGHPKTHKGSQGAAKK